MRLTSAKTERKAIYAVDPIFINRWSPRSMTGEPIEKEELMALFEAAHWAPSSFNNQPWRFLYARRDTPQWLVYLDLLEDDNRVWARNAAVLVVIVSRKTFEKNGKPSKTHTFDAGAAWGYLALQGSMRGLAVHGMEGFDYQKAQANLGIPAEFEVHAMAAIGRQDSKEDLPKDLKAIEKPNTRKPVEEVAIEGRFGADSLTHFYPERK